MSAYGIADAKAGLPGLINRAIAGEEVIITRHGKPVAELRPTTTPPASLAERIESYRRLKEARLTPLGPPITSVELLNKVYEDWPKEETEPQEDIGV
jgi:prevent-host-death family protein